MVLFNFLVVLFLIHINTHGTSVIKHTKHCVNISNTSVFLLLSVGGDINIYVT